MVQANFSYYYCTVLVHTYREKFSKESFQIAINRLDSCKGQNQALARSNRNVSRTNPESKEK